MNLIVKFSSSQLLQGRVRSGQRLVSTFPVSFLYTCTSQLSVSQWGWRGGHASRHRLWCGRTERRWESEGEMDTRGGDCHDLSQWFACCLENLWACQRKESFYRTADINMLISLCLQDDKLKALVQKLGTGDWKCIASYIPVSLIDSCCLLQALGFFFWLLVCQQ